MDKTTDTNIVTREVIIPVFNALKDKMLTDAMRENCIDPNRFIALIREYGRVWDNIDNYCNGSIFGVGVFNKLMKVFIEHHKDTIPEGLANVIKFL